MKKGLLITLLLAVMVASAYAYAPVMSSIPDVYIGDNGEDGTFIFSDAFVFTDYVSDQDTDVADLEWSFSVMADPTPVGEVLINGLGEETDDVTFVAPTNELTALTTTATFYDKSGTELATLSDQFIALYVSDGESTDMESFRVLSTDGTDDALSQLAIDPTYSTDFTGTNTPNVNNGDYWQLYNGDFGQGTSTFGEFDAANDRLSMKMPADFGNNYYQWLEIDDSGNGTKQVVDCQAGKTYVAKINLSSQSDTVAPNIRVRIQDNDFGYAAMAQYASGYVGAGGFPTTTPEDFYVIWEPQGASGKVYMAFDAWQTSNVGEIYINSINVYEIDTPAATTPVYSATDLAAAGWAEWTGGLTIGANVSYPATNSWTAGAAFATFTTPMVAGDTIRCTYMVSGTANDSDAIRLRVNDSANGASSSMFRFEDSHAPDMDLSATAQPLKIYHRAYNGTDTATSSDVALWLDTIVASDPLDATVGTTGVVLESVSVEKVTLPVLN